MDSCNQNAKWAIHVLSLSISCIIAMFRNGLRSGQFFTRAQPKSDPKTKCFGWIFDKFTSFNQKKRKEILTNIYIYIYIYINIILHILTHN